jgi:parallel beta-helix repeat protein
MQRGNVNFSSLIVVCFLDGTRFLTMNPQILLNSPLWRQITVEKIFGRPLKFLAVICIVPFAMLVLAPLKGFLVSSADPPASGDWIVTGVEIYSNHEVFVLNGNLIVENGGNLTLKGVTLKMNCTYDGQYNITVKAGGAFYVLEGSVITSANSSHGYCFFVLSEATFRMSESELHECGINSSTWWDSGLWIHSGDIIIEKSLISENLCAMFGGGEAEPIIRNNNITDNKYGIHIASGHPAIYNNTITSNLNFGIASGGNTAFPVIVNNSISKNGAGINCWFGSGPTILNNTITSNFDNAIFINHDGNATISGNIITLNGGGIVCFNHTTGVIQNNTIMANRGDGISFNDYSNATIQDNTISGNGRGVFCGSSSPIVQSNTITLNGHGIYLDASNASIQGNTIEENQIGIIAENNSSPTIQGNIVKSNNQGIQIVHNCSVTIQGNIITSNMGIGIYCNDTAQLEVHKNDIYSNADYGIKNDDPSITINATSNYWGNASGPVTESPDAIDPEEVSGNVLFDLWLTESIIFAEITNPIQGQTVSATVKISTNAHAINNVFQVKFYVDNQQKYVDSASPYEWDWNTTQYAETSHEITVKVVDTFGLTTQAFRTVFVDNTAPTVSIKQPESGEICHGIISVTVNATDNKEMDGVRFRVDTNEWLGMIYNSTDLLWKYDLNTTTLSDGQYTLEVRALDKAGNPSTTSVTLRLDNTPPTLSIQTPQSGMTVGSTLIVTVQASDASNISRIEFYLEDVLVHTATNTPYEWSWDTTEYPNGEYSITVKAYDTVGHAQTSQTAVTVENVAPPWWEVHMWTIIIALVAIGGLILAVVTFLAVKKKAKKKEEE